ncbi:ABC transporter permease [Sporolactobacillus sp. CQH2019]|uniref:ABC transporter permease n=1 Tax=Sporolactobacillus sp. CQH2019 TaxID=3023512 RepID=UPI0023677677|nr:ABC transporter permease [Sporolactobacillus sp. CQH2019]MDD9149585.1 ABC transporter permease [Sporolactobacillus sp. CQH2019]
MFKRILYMIVTILLISSVTFLLMQKLPGSPYGNEEKLTNVQKTVMNKQYGLDKPVAEQYLLYMEGVVKGNFGISLQFGNQPVSKIIATRLGPSVQLGIQAILFGTVVGIFFGIIAAMFQNMWLDTSTSLIAILGRSVPNFVFAVLLQLLFAINLKWLPIGLWENGFASSVLPSLALAFAPLADSARFVRTEMIDVLHSDYIELARSTGLSEWEIAVRYGLRNAVIPLITVLGPMVASLLVGSLVVEQIFAVPGIGEQFVKSILSNDYFTIMGLTILYSTFLVVVILIVDLLYVLIDPRIRLIGGSEK